MTNLDGYRPLQPPSTSSAMAPKGHRTGGGLTRTHSRSSSGGGGKLGLNLQLTQKDPGPSKHPDKARRNLHLENGRGSGHVSRTNSSVRVQSKEHVNPAAIRRAPVPRVNSKHKIGFSIASPSEEGDDDEWVSSESGAATPNEEESDPEEVVTPIEKKSQLQLGALSNGFVKDEQPTPRAELTSLPPVEDVRIGRDVITGPPLTTRNRPAPQETPTISEPVTQEQHVPPPRTPSPRLVSPAPKARSETHSPPRRLSPEISKRSMTRPPSTTSIASTASHALRPHPLIRAQSVGYSAFQSSSRPTPLAPLTTSEQIPGSMPITSPTSYRASSPTASLHHAAASPVISQPSPTTSEASRQLRRTSTSSRSSIATLPDNIMRASASHAQLGRTANHDRQRTLSSSSTFAALSSLNLSGMRPTPSPPKPPAQHFVVRFSTAEKQYVEPEVLHALLPTPYGNALLTTLRYRNPLAESYDRVVRAKLAR